MDFWVARGLLSSMLINVSTGPRPPYHKGLQCQVLTNDRRQQPVAVFSGDTVLQQTHLYRRKTDYFASIRITGSRLSDWNRSPKMIHYKTGEKQLALLTSESRSRAITIDRRTGKPVYDLAFVQSLVPSAESISTQAALPDWTHEAVGLSLGTMGNSASGASGQSPFGLHSSLVPESPPARGEFHLSPQKRLIHHSPLEAARFRLADTVLGREAKVTPVSRPTGVS
jgi:hypothetical protein